VKLCPLARTSPPWEPAANWMVQASRLIRSKAANTSSMRDVWTVSYQITAPGSTAAMTFISGGGCGGGVSAGGVSSS